jgi:hypothetical protein
MVDGAVKRSDPPPSLRISSWRISISHIFHSLNLASIASSAHFSAR